MTRIRENFLDNATFVVVLATKLWNASTSLGNQAPGGILPKASTSGPHISQVTRETSERAIHRTMHRVWTMALTMQFTVTAIRLVVRICT